MSDYERAWADPELQRWMAHVRHQVLPKIDASAMTMVVAPSGEPDIKIAVELGLSILLNKPIIAVVSPGQVPPPGLARVAHETVVMDPADSTASAEAIQAAMRRVDPR